MQNRLYNKSTWKKIGYFHKFNEISSCLILRKCVKLVEKWKSVFTIYIYIYIYVCVCVCVCVCVYTYNSSSSSVICQMTGPKPLAKWFLHIVQSRASSFNSHYPLLSLRSSSNFLRLLPCLLVTSICPFFFPSITCFRKQFLRKM